MQFEYKIVKRGEKLTEEELNEFGKGEWELVDVFGNPTTHTPYLNRFAYTFKREYIHRRATSLKWHPERDVEREAGQLPRTGMEGV